MNEIISVDIRLKVNPETAKERIKILIAGRNNLIQMINNALESSINTSVENGKLVKRNAINR
jgi:hypothetical protein